MNKYFSLILIFFLLGRVNILKSDTIDTTINTYRASLILSSQKGSFLLKIIGMPIINTFSIHVYNTSNDALLFSLLYEKGSWSFKKPTSKSNFFPISDTNVLKTLNLDSVMPNSKIFIQFLKGSYPYKSYIKKHNYFDATVHINYNDLIQRVIIKDNKLSLIVLKDKNTSKALVFIKFSTDGVLAPDFFMPSNINIFFADNKPSLKIKLTNFNNQT